MQTFLEIIRKKENKTLFYDKEYDNYLNNEKYIIENLP